MTHTPHPSASGCHLLPQGEKGLSRRALLASALALTACDRNAAAAPAIASTPLKSIAPFPIGTAAMTGQFEDRAWSTSP